MRVEDFLRDTARRLPGKTALVAGSTRLSYADLDALSDRMAAAVVAGGVMRRDRVVLMMENSWQLAVAVFAVLKAGAVVSPVSVSMKAAKLAGLLNDCSARAVIADAGAAGTVEAAAAGALTVRLIVLSGGADAGLATGRIRFEDALADIRSPLPSGAGIGLDLATLIYTSGTTGEAKGVMMTHGSVMFASRSVISYLESRESDVVLCVLPLSHSYGLYQLFMAAAVGATLVLEKSFAFPQLIFAKMAEEGVTGLPLVPTMAAIICAQRSLSGGQFPALRYITNAAAALPPARVARLREIFPNVRLYAMYGQTECKRATYLPPDQIEARPDSVGVAIPGTEAYVVDDQGRRLGPGVAGELVVRGPHLMKGYWGKPEATARALRPGPYPWERVLHTGDLFRSDAEGYLYFVGRRDDIIKTRGEKVSPAEVEAVLHALPGVREAAAIGVTDPVLGTAIRAVIVLAPDAKLTAHDIIRHCARNLEDFMVPKSVVFRDALPKTESGKISRRLIEAEVMETAA